MGMSNWKSEVTASSLRFLSGAPNYTSKYGP